MTLTEGASEGFALARRVLDAALDCVVVIDAAGAIVDVNAATERTFKLTREQAIGVEMAELIVPPELRRAHRAGLRRYLRGGEPRVLDTRIEILGLRGDGSRFPVELTITRVDIDGEILFVGYLRDITDRLAAERELRETRTRILEAGYLARRRIERDLHDGAQQHLVGLALTLRLALDRVVSDPAGTAALLEEATVDLEAASAELRELARGIHPVVLTEGGLAPALRALASRAPIPVEVDVEGLPDARLPEPVEATAYFVIAEALTNVYRYADAASAGVRLVHSGDVLVIEVSDDGRGGADPAAGSGILGLAARVAAHDGNLTIESPSGEGTILRAEVPCASS